MAKKIIKSDFCVVIQPGVQYRGISDKEAEDICHDMVPEIKRHIDYARWVSVQCETEVICSFCGYPWEEVDPGCCGDAYNEWKEAQHEDN